jgi:Arabinose-binding domain of AraC transcription regulator, N-term
MIVHSDHSGCSHCPAPFNSGAPRNFGRDDVYGTGGRRCCLDIPRHSIDIWSSQAFEKGPDSVRTRPTISLTVATGLIEAVVAAGANPDEVLRAVGLDRSALSSPRGFIACADFTRLLEAASQFTGDDDFGLRFGEHYQPKNIGPLAYVVLNSPTFAMALENVGRYLRAHNDGLRASFTQEDKWARLELQLVEPAIEIPRQHNEYGMAVVLGMIRLMAGTQWAPSEVQFAHPAPRDTAEHIRVFRSPVSFSRATNAFLMEREFVDRPVPAADARLYPILQRYLDRVLDEIPREDELLASVRKAVGESMRDGDPTLAKVARKIALSPRTLCPASVETGVPHPAGM